jgi:hypothetical protein
MASLYNSTFSALTPDLGTIYFSFGAINTTEKKKTITKRYLKIKMTGYGWKDTIN